jgi:hypothetical protein
VIAEEKKTQAIAYTPGGGVTLIWNMLLLFPKLPLREPMVINPLQPMMQYL